MGPRMKDRRKETVKIHLRDVIESDLTVFFEQQLDPVANHMAAFTAKDPADRDAFNAHSRRNLADPQRHNENHPL